MFPAPIPSSSVKLNEVCKLFELLGLFLAKCMQDGRRVDIPLSESFLELMCFKQGLSGDELRQVPAKSNITPEESLEAVLPLTVNCEDLKADNNPASTNTGDEGATGKEILIINVEEGTSRKDSSKEDDSSEDIVQRLATHSTYQVTAPWFRGILTINDLCSLDSHRGKFLIKLQEFIKRKINIIHSASLSENQKKQAVSDLMFEDNSHLRDLM